jgi:DNA mismatch endonuclease (patch repair protein)
MDRLTPERRSWNMSRIKGRDTGLELVVRSALHRLGFRFRLHGRKLPGRPDVVLPRHRAVLFVHGCFWHRHRGCRFAYQPKSNISFWTNKFEETVARDSRNSKELRRLGWRVIVVWECQTADREALSARLAAALTVATAAPTAAAKKVRRT